MEKLTVTDLGNGVWQFDEDDYVDAYLIVGQSSALLVDALMSERGLLDAVRRVTKLPLTVAITHGHGDHAGRETANFLKASIPQYLSPADLPGLEKMAGESLSGRFLPLEPGQVFDLGDRRLEAIPLPGHTVGGMAFLDRENELLFSGDGIGSGMIWMQLPGCLPLEEYLSAVGSLRRETAGLSNLLIYPGHRNQSPVQLTGQYIDDVSTCTEKILTGELVGVPYKMPEHFHFPYPVLQASFGTMLCFCYNPENLRRG